MTLPVVFEELLQAAERLDGVARRTPVFTSSTLDGRFGAHLFCKGENFQRVGAFKFRGAYNALSRHKEQSGDGIITASSGNHAQAVALAGRLLEIPTTIVMPDDAPRVKLAATRGYGGDVVLYDRLKTTREALAAHLAEERGLVEIPAYDHADIIAGQGTAALELIREVGELDLLLAPCGGGGLLSGTALAAHELSPRCRIVGVEPELADDAARSFRSGKIESVHNPPTIADGARTPSLGERNFEIIRSLVDGLVTVSEESIVEAMRFYWERMKLVVEPTGAVALAALFEGKVDVAKGAKTGVIISGGNVDLDHAAHLFREFRAAAAPAIQE